MKSQNVIQNTVNIRSTVYVAFQFSEKVELDNSKSVREDFMNSIVCIKKEGQIYKRGDLTDFPSIETVFSGEFRLYEWWPWVYQGL